MAPLVYGFSPWLNTFVMFENTKDGSWLVVPSLSSSNLFEVKFHQFLRRNLLVASHYESDHSDLQPGEYGGGQFAVGICMECY